MSLVWIPSLEGYIADTPNIDFKRSDEAVFNFDKVNTASVNFELDNQELRGAQYRLPVSIIDTTERIEFTFESSDFTMDLFELAHIGTNDGDSSDGISILETHKFEIDSDYSVSIPFEVDPNSVYIRGQKEAASASPGYFGVEIVRYDSEHSTELIGTWEAGLNEAILNVNRDDVQRLCIDCKASRLIAEMNDFDDEEEIPTLIGINLGGNPHTQITFDPTDVEPGEMVNISYMRKADNIKRTVVTNMSTMAIGSLTIHFPVYSSGNDCTMSSIFGWFHIHFYKVRVTQIPNINASFKSTQTFGLTFTALDPRRTDGALYEYSFELL